MQVDVTERRVQFRTVLGAVVLERDGPLLRPRGSRLVLLDLVGRFGCKMSVSEHTLDTGDVALYKIGRRKIVRAGRLN